jgi:hypothetical protein
MELQQASETNEMNRWEHPQSDKNDKRDALRTSEIAARLIDEYGPIPHLVLAQPIQRAVRFAHRKEFDLRRDSVSRGKIEHGANL